MIYVDELEAWGSTVGYHGEHAAQAERVGARNGHRWCHLFADKADCEELHDFARAIGLKREWFQGDHYDLTPGRRSAALNAGAKPVDRKRSVAIWRKQRERKKKEAARAE